MEQEHQLIATAEPDTQPVQDEILTIQTKPPVRKKRGKRAALILAVCAAALLLLGCAADLLGCPPLRYCSGVAKLQRDRFVEAQTVFRELGDYPGAADRLAEAEKGLRYQKAQDLQAQGRYADALAIYEELGDFRESAKKLRETRYHYAVELLAQGEREAAKALLVKVGNYADALELFDRANKEIRYESALQRMEEKDYLTAAEEFHLLSGFMDAREKEEECRTRHTVETAYADGRKLYLAGDWLGAYRTLEPIRSYDYLETENMLSTILTVSYTYTKLYADTGERGKALAFLRIVEEHDPEVGGALRAELFPEEIFVADNSFYYFDTTHIERFTANTPKEEFASVVLYMLIYGKMNYSLMSNKEVDYDLLLDRAFQGADLVGEIIPGYGSIYNPSVTVGDNYVVYYLDHEQTYNEFQRTQHLKLFKSFCEDSVRQLTELGLLGGNMTRRQEAEVIINWVGFYLTYDHSLTTHDVGAAIESRRGVCESFAALYNRMCNLAGIPTYGQIGLAGPGEDARHIWSFHLDEDGNIFFADATWADPWSFDYGAPGQETPTVEQFAEQYLKRCMLQALVEQKDVSAPAGYESGTNVYVYSVKRWLSHEAERTEEEIIAYHARITGKAA